MKFCLNKFAGKKFSDKMDQTRFIKENKSRILAEKLAWKKDFVDVPVLKAGFGNMSFEPEIESNLGDIIEVKAIINSTNLIDSHLDLHLYDIWDDSPKNDPFTPILQSHKRDFEYLINAKGKNINEKMNFLDLGLKIDFDFTANISIFTVDKNKNPLMWDKYVSGEVTQHSIGMIYLDYDIAFYDEDSKKEMDFFEEMKAKAINPEVADEYGYFWVVRKAGKREGSPVVFGSNSVTPTLYVKNASDGQKRGNSNKSFLYNPNLI